MSMLIRKWIEKWRSYRYRFVPWIALNLRKRTVREVGSTDQDKTVPDTKVIESLLTVLHALHDIEMQSANDRHQSGVMYKTLGYEIKRLESSIPGAGKGVFVTKGDIAVGSLVALYPGTIYWPYEPILIQSVGNPFVFRCIDGILIDGNDKGLSKMIYRSSAGRDQIGPYLLCDTTWLTNDPQNPLAVGQYVNNRTKNKPANVAYQEVDIPLQSVAPKLWKYLPNVWYSSGNIAGENSFLRIIALVSVCKICEGDEVLSSYFTVVN